MSHVGIFVGSFFAGTAVILGAFGAHYLKLRIAPAELIIFETAVRYQMYHALALILIGILSMSIDKYQLRLATYLFTTGICLFSGSLYVLAFTKTKIIGILTPFGGLLLIIAWFMVALSAL